MLHASLKKKIKKDEYKAQAEITEAQWSYGRVRKSERVHCWRGRRSTRKRTGTELDKLKKGIAKHRDHIFTFLTNPAVPPTNNDSEKALRPAKTKLKVSGCFRTESGAENYATVASVIQTAVKNGQNPFEVLRVIAALALA